jgi:hypothetical protein
MIVSAGRWEGHFRQYETHDGITVAMEGDVGWYVDDVWRPVWQGRVTTSLVAARR